MSSTSSSGSAWIGARRLQHFLSLEHHVKQILGSLDFDIKKGNRQVSVEEAMQLLGDDTRFATVIENGSMIVEIYEPIGKDHQTPHAQDELYVIISGNGEFLNDGKITEFKTGDVLFVPAGVEHRFEKFTEDFKTWVIFYGAMERQERAFLSRLQLQLLIRC